MKFILKKLKELSYAVSFFRILVLLRASALYLIPTTKRRVIDDFSSGRSIEKMDPAYDLSLYTEYKKSIQQFHPHPYTTMLDLGSGDGVIHAVQFILHDAVSRFYLVDEFLFPQTIYAKIESYLESPSERERVKNSLSLVNTGGGALTQVPNDSVDIVISTSLFEHVLRKDVPALIGEIWKKLSENGTAILSIDLRDHYDFSRPFFFYRHPEWLWKLMTYNRGKYMNRLRAGDFVQILKEYGFTIINIKTEKSDAPLPRRSASQFIHYSEDDLRTVHIVVVARKVSIK